MSQADVIPFKRPPLLKQQPALKHFKRITGSIAVESLRGQLEANPGLWNQHTARTDENSPHFGVDDLWIRFRRPEELTEPKNYVEEHFPVWYPAWDKLPALKPIIFGLAHMVRATHLGGILITRIHPGGRVRPHQDAGWHATFHDTKVYVAIQSNPGCFNYTEDECTVIKVGEAVSFNNLLTHSVENTGVTDRITLIICMSTQ